MGDLAAGNIVSGLTLQDESGNDIVCDSLEKYLEEIVRRVQRLQLQMKTSQQSMEEKIQHTADEIRQVDEYAHEKMESKPSIVFAASPSTVLRTARTVAAPQYAVRIGQSKPLSPLTGSGAIPATPMLSPRSSL